MVQYNMGEDTYTNMEEVNNTVPNLQGDTLCRGHYQNRPSYPKASIYTECFDKQALADIA